MVDCREKLTKELEVLYQSLLESEEEVDSFDVCNRIVKALADYEIIERCTDIVPVDDVNAKILKRYTACLRLDGKSEATIYQYTRACQRLSDLIKATFTEIGTYELRYFLATEKERGISNVTVENIRANLSAFFGWMTNEELIPKNPMSKISPIKCHQENKMPFSEVEIDALRGGCKNKKERAIIELLLASGIRVSELTGMKEKDIDFQALTVRVVNGKGNKET